VSNVVNEIARVYIVRQRDNALRGRLLGQGLGRLRRRSR
jgi:hypothetical protein